MATPVETCGGAQRNAPAANVGRCTPCDAETILRKRWQRSRLVAAGSCTRAPARRDVEAALHDMRIVEAMNASLTIAKPEIRRPGPAELRSMQQRSERRPEDAGRKMLGEDVALEHDVRRERSRRHLDPRRRPLKRAGASQSAARVPTLGAEVTVRLMLIGSSGESDGKSCAAIMKIGLRGIPMRMWRQGGIAARHAMGGTRTIAEGKGGSRSQHTEQVGQRHDSGRPQPNSSREPHQHRKTIFQSARRRRPAKEGIFLQRDPPPAQDDWWRPTIRAA